MGNQDNDESKKIQSIERMKKELIPFPAESVVQGTPGHAQELGGNRLVPFRSLQRLFDDRIFRLSERRKSSREQNRIVLRRPVSRGPFPGLPVGIAGNLFPYGIQ
jgi:hypothetical protein